MREPVRRRRWIFLLGVADLVLLCLLFGRCCSDESVTACGEAYGPKADVAAETMMQMDEAPECKRIALTFDDGPNHIYTEPLLDGLKERGVKATFFLIGNEVEKHPEIARRIAEEGHVIGNHSFYHVDLSSLSAEEAVFQVSRTNEVIYEVTGQYPQYLRPPFGRSHPAITCEQPMIEVLWTIDSRDWAIDDVGTVVMNVIPEAEDNDIILMHDASSTSVAAALSIVDNLKQKGYDFVTLDEILSP